MTATATMPAPSSAGTGAATGSVPQHSANGNGQYVPSKPLWPKDVKIEVIGVTGPYMSGKTLFISTIAPGKHPDGHRFAGSSRTKMYDFEKSSGTYQGLGNDRVDVPSVLQALHPTGYKPIQLFQWFLGDVRQIPAGKYDAICIDTAGDVEVGLADYVKARYAEYGFKSDSAFESTGGIFWSQVREFWKTVLADLASKCQCFAFASHLKVEWSGGKPTSRKKPAGKSTLMELSSLYLVLDRSPDGSGAVPEKPRCKFLYKNRVTFTDYDAAKDEVIIKPYLPPAFDDATPAKIREYILKPANYDKLKKDERVREDTISEDEKQLREAEIAENRRVTEETAFARLNRQAELQELARKSREDAASRPSTDQSARVNAEATATAARQADAARAASAASAELPFDANKQGTSQTATTASGAASPSPNGTGAESSMHGRVNSETVNRLIELKQALGMPQERFLQGIRKNTNGNSENPLDLHQEVADKLVGAFEELLAKKTAEKNTKN